MKILRSSIKIPDKKKLDKLIVLSYEEVCSLKLTFISKNKNNSYMNKFIFASIQRISEILLALSKLSHRHIDSMHILMRSLLEVNVDLLWVFSIYKDKNDHGENLAKRFYQLGAKSYLEISENYENLFKQDLFLSKIAHRYKHDKFVEDAAQFHIIDLVDEKADKNLRFIQSTDWHALPELIKSRQEISFKARSEIAAQFANKLFRLKYAPYYQNWKILNAFTHWSSLHMKFFDDEVSDIFYTRNLNASLGFLHDSLNVGYHFLNVLPPKKIELMRKEFCYFST